MYCEPLWCTILYMWLIGILVAILLVVGIVAVVRYSKKTKLEIDQLEKKDKSFQIRPPLS